MLDQLFEKRQRVYWLRADEVRFHWQTRNPVVAPREAELAARLTASAGERVLEIGCGEGANLHHLRATGALRFGVDYSQARASFAQRSTGARVVTADGKRLPFADAAFDAVLIRDVLHHVEAKAAVLDEARRVLRQGGRLTLVEPNRASPLIWLQAALIPEEREVLRSSSKTLARALEDAGFSITRQTTEHPFPIERVILHPHLSAPSLAERPIVARALTLTDRIARSLLPRGAWMYLVFEAQRT